MVSERAASWWRHRGPRLLIASELLVIIALATLGPTLGIWVAIAALAVNLAGMAMIYKHERYWWCDICVDEAGPRPGYRLSRRSMSLLFYMHYSDNNSYEAWMFLPFLIGVFLYPGLAGILLMCVVSAAAAFRWYTVDLHQRLALYCPHCQEPRGPERAARTERV